MISFTLFEFSVTTSSRYNPLCFNRSFPNVHYSHAYALEHLKLNILHERTFHFDALFHFQVCFGSKFYPLL
jgi:hypothetical protein